MEYKELIEELKIQRLQIHKNIYLWGDTYSYKKIGSSATLIIPRKIKEGLRHIKHIINEVEGSFREKTTEYELSWSSSLEWLFFYFAYGIDYKSNCILCNLSGDILGISYKGFNCYTIIYSDIVNPPNYIVINNKLKFEGKFKKSDINFLSDILRKLFDNTKEICAE